MFFSVLFYHIMGNKDEYTKSSVSVSVSVSVSEILFRVLLTELTVLPGGQSVD